MNSLWNDIIFYIFDLPEEEKNFPIRYNKLKQFILNYKNIQVIPIIKCKGNKHLQIFLKKIENLKGIGVILLKDEKLCDPASPFLLEILVCLYIYIIYY